MLSLPWPKMDSRRCSIITTARIGAAAEETTEATVVAVGASVATVETAEADAADIVAIVIADEVGEGEEVREGIAGVAVEGPVDSPVHHLMEGTQQLLEVDGEIHPQRVGPARELGLEARPRTRSRKASGDLVNSWLLGPS